MKATIYKIENLKTSDCYIGSTVNFNRRKKRHFDDLINNRHHSIILQRAFSKYGASLFRIFIINSFDYESKEQILQQEQFYIDLIKPKYNICLIAGSQLGSKRTKEFKTACSQRMKGKLPWNKGLKTGIQSEKTRLKRSNSLKGKKRSIETKQLISLKATGRKFTEEHKLKLSKAKINNGNACKK